MFDIIVSLEDYQISLLTFIILTVVPLLNLIGGICLRYQQIPTQMCQFINKRLH